MDKVKDLQVYPKRLCKSVVIVDFIGAKARNRDRLRKLRDEAKKALNCSVRLVTYGAGSVRRSVALVALGFFE